ncbi:hypothetical protein MasN3_39820 [Massilia varians]|uniref:Uncharacterized protein n=1 Tax=Massilia varians TaxID=457921 RepID=A0ABN6TGJ3_9BURK|nr:hypothetical protein [Massilia varians]BDT60488.1 hypothetical protein MasN3_39820 [Massilia varians]
MTSAVIEYFEALERLRVNRPIRVPKNTKITNDSVSIEAGRGKGSIKKSRAIFQELIAAIDEAALEQSKSKDAAHDKLVKAKGSAAQYREMLDAALAREVSLLWELYAVKKQLAALTGGNVLPLRGA